MSIVTESGLRAALFCEALLLDPEAREKYGRSQTKEFSYRKISQALGHAYHTGQSNGFFRALSVGSTVVVRPTKLPGLIYHPAGGLFYFGSLSRTLAGRGVLEKSVSSNWREHRAETDRLCAALMADALAEQDILCEKLVLSYSDHRVEVPCDQKRLPEAYKLLQNVQEVLADNRRPSPCYDRCRFCNFKGCVYRRDDLQRMPVETAGLEGVVGL